MSADGYAKEKTSMTRDADEGAGKSMRMTVW
jgi:hypothetical protein